MDAWILSHYVSAYPLCQYLFNNSHCISAYRIHFDIHLRQHIKHIVCLFVVLKATKGRKVHKRDNCVSMYPALSGIQL